jgi:hypothetical protein
MTGRELGVPVPAPARQGAFFECNGRRQRQQGRRAVVADYIDYISLALQKRRTRDTLESTVIA